MPNWCTNQLEVTGAKEAVKKFAADVRVESAIDREFNPLSFAKILPCPEDLKSTDKGILADGEYHWNIENWGTKWDACDVTGGDVTESIDDSFIVEYEFETAWRHCDAWLTTISKMYPDLKFRLGYYEPGMSFQGELIIENGEVVYENQEDFNPSDWGLEDEYDDYDEDDDDDTDDTEEESESSE